jgi:hypothetical protein
MNYQPKEMAEAMKWLCKHVSTAIKSHDHSKGHTHTHTTEELLKAGFSMWSGKGYIPGIKPKS